MDIVVDSWRFLGQTSVTCSAMLELRSLCLYLCLCEVIRSIHTDMDRMDMDMYGQGGGGVEVVSQSSPESNRRDDGEVMYVDCLLEVEWW